MLSRRELLRAARRTVVQVAVLLGAGQVGGCKRSSPRAPQGPFTLAEERTLAAALNQLLPGGGGLPDAREAGVLGYLRQELSRPHLRGIVQRVRRGLAELDDLSVRDRGRPFHAIPPAEQRECLRRMQRGQVRRPGFHSGVFFEILLTLALEGYLGAPSHGGNVGGRVWRALGIAGA